jgi:lipopolysaccharide export system protein LptA
LVKKFTYPLLLVLAAVSIASAKQRTDTLQPGKKLEIRAAKRLNMQVIDTTTFTSLAEGVVVQQENTFFYADSAVLNQKLNTLEAFGHVHINDADSVHTYSDYLKYLGKEKKAYLNKNVKLTDGKGTLTTSELEYDVNTKIGTYTKGGKVVNGKTVLTSKEGYYYGETRDIIFKKKVVLKDPGFDITTDTLLYNTYFDKATFIAQTKIITGSRKIKTRDGWYDLKNKKAYFGSNSEMEDSSGTIKSEIMTYDDSTQRGDFRKNVVYKGKDTANGYDLIANHLETDNKKGSFRATENPILIIKQKGDSIFIRADTMYSAKLSDLLKERKVPSIRDSITGKLVEANEKDSSTNKFFEAYSHVRIFSDSTQAVADSMFYSPRDSAFRLFKNPIVWGQSNQLTGDTIYLYLENNNPQKARVFENAMAVSHAGSNFYNQVAGKTMDAFFAKGKINFLRTKGSPAESIYYGQDDSARFVGVNKSSSDIIDTYFEDGQVHKIVFRNKLEGTSYPMGQVNHIEIRLRGFKWLEARRPKSKFEILSE